MRQKYPGVDLELEALKAAEWLMEPRNAKRRCSKAFLDRWLAKASADGMAPIPFSGTNTGRPAPRSVLVNGSPFVEGRCDPPAAFQRTPDPEGLPVFDADLERVPLAPRRNGTLKEKLAAIKGGKP
jgi:hypothetical protein